MTPKFKVGDIVVDKDADAIRYKVLAVGDNNYTFRRCGLPAMAQWGISYADGKFELYEPITSCQGTFTKENNPAIEQERDLHTHELLSKWLEQTKRSIK